MSAAQPQADIVEQLRRKIAKTQPAAPRRDIVSTDLASLDRMLPEHGLPRGAMVEWISDRVGQRATSLAFRAASRLLQQPGAFGVVDPLHCLNAASLPPLGIPLSRLLLVRPQFEGSTLPIFDSSFRLPTDVRSDCLWSLEQLARCRGVNVVLTWVDRLSTTAQRRLQLATEHSGTTVILIRPNFVLNQPSWADLRFHVHLASTERDMNNTRVAVTLAKSKNSVQRSGEIVLNCHHETGAVSETSELADPAATAASIA